MHLFFALAIAVASFFRLHTAGDGGGPGGHLAPAPAPTIQPFDCVAGDGGGPGGKCPT